MKRNCLIIALLLAIVSVSGANMFTNGGFESLGWTFLGNSGRTDWSCRSDDYGGALWGWDPGASGGIQQDVACPGTGVYTFTAFFLQEKNFNPSTFELKIEGSSGGPQSETPTVASHIGLPRDGFWHEIFVTATITNPATTVIRPVINLVWSGSGIGQEGVLFDDTALYAGPHTGSVVQLSNPSFEKGRWESGVGFTNAMFRGSQWAEVPEDVARGERAWGNRSGTNGVALKGWDPVDNVNIQISQPIYSGTGTYTFAVWISREDAFNLSNVQLRIEWYDVTCSNKVQADSVANFLVPNDNKWREYWVTGTCTSNSLYEIRPVINPLWNSPTNAGGNAARIDDARWLRGTYDGYSVNTDWAYHSAVGERAIMEQVPVTNVGTFLQVNYNTHTNTFRILTLNPTFAKFANLGDGGEVWLHTWWERPGDLVGMDQTWPMTKRGTVQISSSSFRGQPASGTATVDVWEASIPQPTNSVGVFYTTNSIRIYYAPYLKTTNGITTTDLKYLLRQDGELTNALGQIIGPDNYGRDYQLDVYKPPTQSTFTNGGFENPPLGPSTLDGSGWFGIGDVGRESWAARSGGAGAIFRSWGGGSFGLYQDVATTGGTYQFAGWMKVQTSAAPTLLKIKMEWYDKSGSLVVENSQDLLALFHKENDWSRIGVVGSCTASNLDYVRLLLVGEFGSAATGDAATEFDDMEFGSVATNLQNAGFEIGAYRDIRNWYGAPQYLVHAWGWAAHTGTNGVVLQGWLTTNALPYEAKLYQPIVAPTGSYVCSAWIQRQASFNVSNAELRIEWYSGSYTGKVQADTVLTLNLPNDAAWHQYAVTGTCNNTALRFVQPVVFVQWSTNGATANSLMIDDIALTYTNLAGGGTTDGIPDSWWALYGITGGDRTALGDYDSDGYLNIEEYAGDTVPTNNGSYFSDVTNAPSSDKSVMVLIVNPSSSTRVYDAWWKTNLMDPSAWQGYGLTVPGTGGLIRLTVTNGPIYRFYRSGAKMP